MTHRTVGSNLTSAPRSVPKGAIVTVTPEPGATALVESTNATAADVANGVAVWATWPKGAVQAETSLQANDHIFIRVKAASGSVTYLVNEMPSSRTLAPFLADWESGAVPMRSSAPWGQSLLSLGDSISIAGQILPNIPLSVGVRTATPTYTNLNSAGQFIIRTFLSQGTPTSAGSVIRFYAADNTLTFQATGDTEGPRVPVNSDMMYTLPSGNPAFVAYLGTLPRNRPTADKSDAVTNIGGTVTHYSDCSSAGILGWMQTLLGKPFATTTTYAIDGAKSGDILAARRQWEGIVTDVTHIFLGTNDVINDADPTLVRGKALSALANLEALVSIRQAVGSAVVVGCLMPHDIRESVTNQAAAEFNFRVREMSERMGFRVWDAMQYVALPTGLWVPAYTKEGLHPSAIGAYIIAKRAIVPVMTDMVRRYTPTIPSLALADATSAPYGNLLPNPGMTGTAAPSDAGVSGTLPTSWRVARDAGSTITAVCTAPDAAGAEALPDGKQGKYFTVAITQQAGAVESIRIRPQTSIVAGTVYAPGDYIVFEGEFLISGTGIRTVYVQYTTGGGSNTASFAINEDPGTNLTNLDGDTVRIPFRSKPCKVEPGSTAILPGIVTSMLSTGGTCTIKIPQGSLILHKVPAPV